MFRSTSLIFDFSLRRPLNKNIIFKCIRYLYVPLLWSIDGDLCINKIDPRTANFDSNRHVIRIVSWVIKRTWISGFGITPSKTVFATTTDVFEEKKPFTHWLPNDTMQKLDQICIIDKIKRIISSNQSNKHLFQVHLNFVTFYMQPTTNMIYL